MYLDTGGGIDEQQAASEDVLVFAAAKPCVRYSRVLSRRVAVGLSVWLLPVDHPRGQLNGKECLTSRVVACNADLGRIETLNTIYLPQVGAAKRPYFVIE